MYNVKLPPESTFGVCCILLTSLTPIQHDSLSPKAIFSLIYVCGLLEKALQKSFDKNAPPVMPLRSPKRPENVESVSSITGKASRRKGHEVSQADQLEPRKREIGGWEEKVEGGGWRMEAAVYLRTVSLSSSPKIEKYSTLDQATKKNQSCFYAEATT